ncbi:MAG: hypothetical protein PGN13_11115 [Patulibacter minatonensis]
MDRESAELVEEVLAWRLALGGAPSNLVQSALAASLRSGAFDRGIARMRRRCAAQRVAITAAISSALPGHRIEGVAAGLHVAVRVPGIEPWRLLVAGQARGVRVFATDDGADALLLVGFGLVEPSAATRVAAELAAIVADARAAASAESDAPPGG